ncbi:MAG: hypothetical protein PVG39_30635 [Desulfobacteraceae bacterium]|jgi:hypothetical protein
MKRLNLFTIIITAIISLFISGFAFADDISADDWVTNTSSGNTYVANGNVGIGTNTPTARLEVSRLDQSPDSALKVFRGDTSSGYRPTYPIFNVFNGQAGSTEVFRVQGNGNVGIGANLPTARLEVSRIDQSPDSALKVHRGDTSSSYRPTYPIFNVFNGQAGSTEVFRVQGNGNVGIGTTSPQSKLAVNGKITAEEVEVISNVVAAEFKVNDTSWSDFVFEDNYNLPTLNQVELYIKENKHLPDIPSAKQVEEEGLSMAGMMKKQMQKIEELTLYVIQLQKKNSELEARLAVVEKDK